MLTLRLLTQQCTECARRKCIASAHHACGRERELAPAIADFHQSVREFAVTGAARELLRLLQKRGIDEAEACTARADLLLHAHDMAHEQLAAMRFFFIACRQRLKR